MKRYSMTFKCIHECYVTPFWPFHTISWAISVWKNIPWTLPTLRDSLLSPCPCVYILSDGSCNCGYAHRNREVALVPLRFLPSPIPVNIENFQAIRGVLHIQVTNKRKYILKPVSLKPVPPESFSWLVRLFDIWCFILSWAGMQLPTKVILFLCGLHDHSYIQ